MIGYIGGDAISILDFTGTVIVGIGDTRKCCTVLEGWCGIHSGVSFLQQTSNPQETHVPKLAQRIPADPRRAAVDRADMGDWVGKVKEEC